MASDKCDSVSGHNMKIEFDGMVNGLRNGSAVSDRIASELATSGENGACCDHNNEDLLRMILELSLQNEFFKSVVDNSPSITLRHERSAEHLQVPTLTLDVKELRERIELLTNELRDEKQTRSAAEVAMTHLREVYAEADARAQSLAVKLAEAQENLDREIKDREAKYSELDSKFQRLHKRAKQRIQDVQKEKDDLEARFNELNGTAEKASSQLRSVQQELERTRQQANEALKAMDAERQSLRSANNRLRDNIDELRRSFEPKENEIEALQQTMLEKDKMLDDMRELLQTAEEKRQASLLEQSAKLQKIIENLEVQLADALADRNKATETMSSLQMVIADRDLKIADMDVALSGEVARLRAAMESSKGELLHQKDKHEKEKENWETAFQNLKMKIEVSEGNCIRAEIEAAKIKSQLESDIFSISQNLTKKETELLAAKDEISRIENEFSSYKFRAHSLLQKKDAEIAASKDSKEIKALDEALKEVQKELSLVSVERDKALQDLQEMNIAHDKQLAQRDEAFNHVTQQIKNVETKLNLAVSLHQSDKRAWDATLENVEEMWRARVAALEAQTESSSGKELQRELDELKLKNKTLKDENNSFRELADRMIEEKDKEISRLLTDNKKLQLSLESRNKVEQDDNRTAVQNEEISNFSSTVAEQQILLLARQQAQREEELAQSQRHIMALQEEIAELERENRLHNQQETMLKAEIRDMERKEKREGVDMTYLKNVILKLLETGEVEALLPVVAMLLQFSPEEMQKCQRAYRASIDAQKSPATETSVTGRSLFPMFPFS